VFGGVFVLLYEKNLGYSLAYYQEEGAKATGDL
jgi:hypothetical protein